MTLDSNNIYAQTTPYCRFGMHIAAWARVATTYGHSIVSEFAAICRPFPGHWCAVRQHLQHLRLKTSQAICKQSHLPPCSPPSPSRRQPFGMEEHLHVLALSLPSETLVGYLHCQAWFVMMYVRTRYPFYTIYIRSKRLRFNGIDSLHKQSHPLQTKNLRATRIYSLPIVFFQASKPKRIRSKKSNVASKYVMCGPEE